MKAYIGNKVICLAQPVEREDQNGYEVLYSDGSETWLVKEIFDFEFRPLDDEEIQIIMSSVIDGELTEEDIKEMFGDFDWEDSDEINLPMEDLNNMIDNFEQEETNAE